VSGVFSWRRLLVLLRKEFVQILGQPAGALHPALSADRAGDDFRLRAEPAHQAPRGSRSPTNRRVPASRELIDAFTANGVFVPHGRGDDAASVYRAVQSGTVDAGLVIPADYAQRSPRRFRATCNWSSTA
jgi:hypothetical protein